MFCPHCGNKIPDGSNICPMCFSGLAGVKPQQNSYQQDDQGAAKKPRSASGKGKKAAYTKGSRGKKKTDKTPMIIAFGLIVILVIIIAMIIISMFGGFPGGASATPVPPVNEQPTQAPSFTVFGATAVPTQRPAEATPTPAIEVTPTPTAPPAVTYHTLRKGDQGPDVVTLQEALTELGYLHGAADGNFGTGTQTAVRKFQEDNGLDSDGIAGKMTLEMLFSKSTVTPIPDTTVAPGDILDLPG